MIRYLEIKFQDILRNEFNALMHFKITSDGTNFMFKYFIHVLIHSICRQATIYLVSCYRTHKTLFDKVKLKI